MFQKHFLAAMALLISICGISQDATSFYNEGLKLKEAKKPAEAIEKFKKAIALKPNYSEAHYESGWCYNDLKDYMNAIISLRKARIGWSNIPKVHFELGYAFQKTDRIDSALECYQRCLQLKPDYSLAFKQLGYIQYDKEKYEAALDYFSKYEANTKVDITDYLYWYRKGFMQNAQKNYTDAILALNKSLERKKDYINTYLELGYAATRLKQADEAIGYFQKAKAIDPKNHVSYNGIAEVYRDIKKDYAEALNWYQKTLDIKVDERKACYGIGYCYNSTGKFSDAIPYLKTAVSQEPTYTAAFVELGYSYYRTQQYADALENLNKAMELNPNNENARYYAVLVYEKQRNKTMAQKMVDALKKISSKYVAELQKRVDAM
ncbi:MAG: tetratricopeptide repeat protein [Bacteroidetes bacterium]|nr:tetratricopeptide repeat protein [Bacteroidota bacterium]